MNLFEIETERLLLRQYRQQDIDAYADMVADPAVMRYVGNGQPLDRSLAWRSMATMAGHWSLKGFGMWAVEEKASGEFIGRVGIFSPDGWPGIEIGWMLRRPFWGKGYAHEAAQVSMQVAFEQLKLERVISLIHPENRASIALALRLGQKLNGESDIDINGVKAVIFDMSQAQYMSQATKSA